MPEKIQVTWTTDAIIGHSNEVDWSDENILSLLVEEDFICLKNTIEDQSDNF